MFCREFYSRQVYAFFVLFFGGKKCARANFYTFRMSGNLYSNTCFFYTVIISCDSPTLGLGYFFSYHQEVDLDFVDYASPWLISSLANLCLPHGLRRYGSLLEHRPAIQLQGFIKSFTTSPLSILMLSPGTEYFTMKRKQLPAREAKQAQYGARLRDCRERDLPESKENTEKAWRRLWYCVAALLASTSPQYHQT